MIAGVPRSLRDISRLASTSMNGYAQQLLQNLQRLKPRVASTWREAFSAAASTRAPQLACVGQRLSAVGKLNAGLISAANAPPACASRSTRSRSPRSPRARGGMLTAQYDSADETNCAHIVSVSGYGAKRMAPRFGAALSALAVSTAHFVILRRFCSANGGLESIYYQDDGTSWIILMALHATGVLAFACSAVSLWRAYRSEPATQATGAGRRAFFPVAVSYGLSAVGVIAMICLDRASASAYGSALFF